MKFFLSILFFVSIPFLTIAQKDNAELFEKRNGTIMIDADGVFNGDSICGVLDKELVAGLERSCVQQVEEFNHYLSELCKTWYEANRSGVYRSESDFLEGKKEFEQLALRLFLFDGEDGIAQALYFHRAFVDNADSTYYRYDNQRKKIRCEHIFFDEHGVPRDSVYANYTIPKVKMWITNNGTSRSVKKHIRGIQTSARSIYGNVRFDGGELCCGPQMHWNGSKQRYEGTIDYCKKIQTIFNEGEPCVDYVHIRIVYYIVPILEEIDGKTYLDWYIKFGNIKVIEV